jgi:hypothetical protein
MPSVRFLQTVLVRDNLLRVIDRFEQIPLLPEKGSRHNPHHANWPIRRSIPILSPKPTNEIVDLSFYQWQATRLTGPKSPACDRYVQYLLTSTNPSVLKRHRRRLPHRNLRITTSLFPPFPSECSTDPPKWLRPISIFFNNYQMI